MSTFNVSETKLGIPLDEIYGGTGTNTYTTGDLLYASNSSTLTKLPIGATGQILTSDGSIPGWSDVRNGVTGGTGNTGNTGDTGTLLAIYLTRTTNQNVGNNANISFTSPPVLTSSIYTYTISGASSTVTVSRTGTYYVAFGVYGSAANTHRFGISVNNAAPLAIYSMSWDDNDVVTSITCLINLNAGDNIRIRNTTGATRTITPIVAGSIAANLSMILING